MGLPVIGTRVGGIPEQLGSDAGVLVESEDVEGLVEAVLSLAGSRELRSSLGDAARRRAGELFSVERQASALDQVYRSALGVARRA